ncbi:MAG TPA: aminoglycoside phosphotransferase family protein [Thermomicrobiales bacterium]|jgi:aminoglycoside phosphotransferase (APT) family kinase protein|nr:aminoglycoside phosphotransferase family protein [Thermomicrobiales bacterium]
MSDDLYAVPVPLERTIMRIARRHGVRRSEISRPPQGVANHTWALGDRLILRIPRNASVLLDDLQKERVIIPLVRAAGVHTPPIVAWETGYHRLAVPAMILERMAGIGLDQPGLTDAQVSVAWETIGRQLARLHRIIPEAGDTGAIPVDLPTSSPSDELGTMIADGAIDAGSGAYLIDLIEILSWYVVPIVTPVLIHGDVAPRNIIVPPLIPRMTGLIDWGDAAWADPAQDFAKLPLPHLLVTLQGYLAERGTDGLPYRHALRTWQARALRYHVEWGIAAANRREPSSGEPLAGSMARLLVVLRFLAETTDPRWDWLKGAD